MPRYKILLQALVKYSTPEDEYYSLLTETTADISAITSEINEKKRDIENQIRVAELQTQHTIRLVAPHRRFIDESLQFLKISKHGGGSTSAKIYLLSDMLLCVKPNLLGGRIAVGDKKIKILLSDPKAVVEEFVKINNAASTSSPPSSSSTNKKEEKGELTERYKPEDIRFKYPKSVDPSLCFNIQSSKYSLSLIATSKMEMARWIAMLQKQIHLCRNRKSGHFAIEIK